MAKVLVPKVVKHRPPSVPKLEPKHSASERQATSGDVTKTGRVRPTEGQGA